MIATLLVFQVNKEIVEIFCCIAFEGKPVFMLVIQQLLYMVIA